MIENSERTGGPIVDLARQLLANVRRQRRNNRISLATMVVLQIIFMLVLVRHDPAAVAAFIATDLILDLLFLRWHRRLEMTSLIDARGFILISAIMHMIQVGTETMREHGIEGVFGSIGTAVLVKTIMGGSNGKWDRKGTPEKWRLHLLRSLHHVAYRGIPGADWRQRQRFIALVQVLIAIEAVRRPTLREVATESLHEVLARIWLAMRRMTPAT